MSTNERLATLNQALSDAPFTFANDLVRAALTGRDFGEIINGFAQTRTVQRGSDDGSPLREVPPERLRQANEAVRPPRPVEVAGPPSTIQAQQERRGDIEIIEDTPDVEPVGDNLVKDALARVGEEAQRFLSTVGLGSPGGRLPTVSAPGGGAGGGGGGGADPFVVASATAGDVTEVVSPGALLEASETAYREAIAEPISTTALVGLEGLRNPAALTNTDTYRDAYSRSQNISPGQAAAGLIYGIASYTNPLVGEGIGPASLPSDAEIAEWLDSPFGTVLSGTFDGVLRAAADPTVLAGAGVGRAAQFSRNTLTREALERALTSEAKQNFIDEAARLSAAEFRRKYLPDIADYAGAEISDILTGLPDRPLRELAVDTLLGSEDAARMLAAERPGIASKIAYHQGIHDMALSGPAFASPDATVRWFNMPHRAEQSIEALNDLVPMEARLDQALRYQGALRTLPRRNVASLVNEEWYRTGRGSAPMRFVTDMEAQPWNLNNLQHSTAQLTRQLEGAEKRLRGLIEKRKIVLRTAGDDADLPEFEAALELLGKERRDSIVNRLLSPTAVEAGEFVNVTASRSFRKSVAMEADHTMLEAFALAKGVTREQAAELVDDFVRRTGTRDLPGVDSSMYDVEEFGVRVFKDQQGVEHHVPHPLLPTQEVLTHIPLDPELVSRALDPITDALKHFGPTARLSDLRNFATGWADVGNSWWKLTRIFRPGYAWAVVPDLAMRHAEQVGIMGWMANHADRIQNFVRERAKAQKFPGYEPIKRGQRGIRPDRLPVEVEGAFGAPRSGLSRLEREVAETAGFEKLVSGERSKIRDQISRTGQFRQVTPDEKVYPQAFEHVANNQLAQHPVGNKLLSGESVQKVTTWLERPGEGRRTLDRLAPSYRRNPQMWVEQVKGQIDRYIPDEGLQRLAANRQLSHADLVDRFPSTTGRPIIHGDFVEDVLGISPRREQLNNAVRAISQMIFRMPIDELVAKPMADDLYRLEVDRLVRLLPDDEVASLSEARLAQISEQARRYAAAQVESHLMGIAEVSDFARMLRFAGPFFMAAQEFANFWLRAGFRNPAHLARMRLLWYAPEKMGMVIDREGRPVEDTGSDLWGDFVAPAIGAAEPQERFLTMRLPEEVRDDIDGIVERIPGGGTIADMFTDGISWNKENANLFGQFPFSGPGITIPLGLLTRGDPVIEDKLKTFFPFGIPSGLDETLRDLVEFPLVAQAARLTDPDDARVLASMKARLYWDAWTQWKRDGADPDDYPDWEEIESKAFAYNFGHVAMRLIGRGATFQQSPFQPYIDSWRQGWERFRDDPMALADDDGNMRDPADWFIDTYGDDYLAAMFSVNRNMDGVPPTPEAFEAFREDPEFYDKIGPDWTGAVLGEEGGEFAWSVWRWKQDQDVALPGDPEEDVKRQEILSEREVRDLPMVSWGWLQMDRVNDTVDYLLEKHGLASLSVSDAEWIKQYRDDQVEVITEQTTIPDLGRSPWRDQWDSRSRDQLERETFLRGMYTVATDPELTEKRNEFRTLAQYADWRLQLVETLAREDVPNTLTAKANQGLRGQWEADVQSLIESDLAFARMARRMRLDEDLPEAGDAELLDPRLREKVRGGGR